MRLRASIALLLALLVCACLCTLATDTSASASAPTRRPRRTPPTPAAAPGLFSAIEGSEKGFSYRLSNFKVVRIDWGALNFPPSPDPVTRLRLNDTRVHATLDWRYKLKFFPWVPRGSGALRLSVAVQSIDATFYPSPPVLGRPPRPRRRGDGSPEAVMAAALPRSDVRLRSLAVELGDVKATVTRSWFSWLYNIILSFFKSNVRAALKAQLESAVAAVARSPDPGAALRRML
jgi:hypothetical protein